MAAVAAVAGVAALTAGGDLKDAEVMLRAGGGVTVTLPGGVSRSAIDGESLPRGAVVSTGSGVTATLDVRDRLVTLAPETTVAVPDGSSADLRRGSILVDRRKGPEVTIGAGAVVVDEIEEGAIRVDRGYSVRISVYSGGARAATSDRHLDVPRLYQAAIAGRALPDRPTPMRLTGDDWERLVIPAVTAADAELSQIARGIDRDARLADPAKVQILPAVYRGALSELPSGTGRSEALLPVAIGLAVDSSRVSDARTLRSAGGSWGVVASLVGARTGSVSARLAELLAGPGEPISDPNSVAVPTLGSTIGSPTSSARPGPTPRPTGSRPTNQPSSSASPSPTASDALDPIIDLLPSATPTPRAASPTPSSLLATPGLIGATPPAAPAQPSAGGGLSGVIKALLG